MRRIQQRVAGVALLISLALFYIWYTSETKIHVLTYDSEKEILAKQDSSTIPTSIIHAEEPDVTSIAIPQVSQHETIETTSPEPQVAQTPIPTSSVLSPEPSHSPAAECMGYESLQRSRQKPWSEGSRQFPYSRPAPECRTFNLPAMEKLIEKMKGVIKDPDLFRLFENSYPNTLDTMIKWRGYAKEVGEDGAEGNVTDEELTYVITGDVRTIYPFYDLSSDTSIQLTGLRLMLCGYEIQHHKSFHTCLFLKPRRTKTRLQVCGEDLSTFMLAI